MAYQFGKLQIYDMIIELTKKELKVRYKHLVFGYVWSILNPLFFVLIYYFVFKLVLNVPTENYPLFLVAGLFPWQWISNSLGSAPGLFWMNSTLIKKTLFPRNLIPFVTTVQDLMHFCFTVPIIILLALYWRSEVSLNWLLWIPLMIFSQFLFTYSMSLLISTLTLFFRDLERFVQILLSLAFYLSPVLYSEHQIPEQFKPLIPLNPFATLLINWRNIILENHFDFHLFFWSLLWISLFFILSHWVYKRLVWKFAELI